MNAKKIICSLCNSVRNSQSLRQNPQSRWELCWSAPLERYGGLHIQFGFASFAVCMIGFPCPSLDAEPLMDLWLLRVSVVLIHLERCMIGKFPILVFWRNVQIDIYLLWRMNFCSHDRFSWFDSITSKLLLMHINKLNCASPYTIS